MSRQGQRLEEGIARNVNWQVMPGIDLLTFTIEQTDHQGNPIRYIPVSCKSEEITGVLVDGDPIRVSGKTSKGGTLIPEEIFNIRTQASIEFKTTKEQVMEGCFQFIFLLLITWVLMGILIS